MDSVSNKFKRFTVPHWLTALLGLVFLLRIPSLFEPFYYGDEMIYLTLGQAVRKGLVLYKDIHDNKPPLLYFLASISHDVFWFRAILLFWFMGTVILFWKLVLVLFPKKRNIQIVSCVFFAIVGSIPLLEGQIANAEIFMLAPTIAGFYILLRKEKITVLSAFLSGLCFSAAALFKIPAAFDTIAIGFLFVFLFFKKGKQELNSFKHILKTGLVFSAGFLIPILFSFIWYALRGAGHDYLVAAYLQNFGYLSSFHAKAQTSFLIKNGPLLIRALLMFVSLSILFVFRKRLPKPFLVSAAWLATSLFAITLSERPYPHYFIQALPTVSIFVGMLAFEETIAQLLAIIPLAVPIFIAVYFKFWYYPSLPYYQNFLGLATNTITKEQYMNHFASDVTKNYQLATHIKLLTNDKERIFVWYDSAPIYAISDRLPFIKYTAGYHIDDFDSRENLLQELKANPPHVIVIFPDSPDIPGLDRFLSDKYVQFENTDGAIIYKRLYY